MKRIFNICFKRYLLQGDEEFYFQSSFLASGSGYGFRSFFLVGISTHSFFVTVLDIFNSGFFVEVPCGLTADSLDRFRKIGVDLIPGCGAVWQPSSLKSPQLLLLACFVLLSGATPSQYSNKAAQPFVHFVFEPSPLNWDSMLSMPSLIEGDKLKFLFGKIRLIRGHAPPPFGLGGYCMYTLNCQEHVSFHPVERFHTLYGFFHSRGTVQYLCNALRVHCLCILV